MSEAEVFQIITARFAQLWTATPVEYENTIIQKTNVSEWVRFTVRPIPGGAIRLGFGRSIRKFGHVFIQVFVNEDIGSGRAMELAHIAGEVFNLYISGKLVFGPASVEIVGDSSSLATISNKIPWFQVNCNLPYSFIE